MGELEIETGTGRTKRDISHRGKDGCPRILLPSPEGNSERNGSAKLIFIQSPVLCQCSNLLLWITFQGLHLLRHSAGINPGSYAGRCMRRLFGSTPQYPLLHDMPPNGLAAASRLASGILPLCALCRHYIGARHYQMQPVYRHTACSEFLERHIRNDMRRHTMPSENSSSNGPGLHL